MWITTGAGLSGGRGPGLLLTFAPENLYRVPVCEANTENRISLDRKGNSMGATAKDIYGLLDKVDGHARAIMALHTELRSMLAQVQFPKHVEWPCPSCGADCGGERGLALHMQNVHDGPAVPLDEAELAG